MPDTTDDVHFHFIPLDPGVHLALAETPEALNIAVDRDDPEAALLAVEALMQERFSSGAWIRRLSTEK